MNWKVYRIYLEKWQPFICYEYNGKIILTSDKDNPYPPTNTYWDKETNTFSKIGQSILPINDVNDFYIKNFESFYDQYINDESYKDFNIILLVKLWGENAEVGYGMWRGEGLNVL